MKVLDSPKLNNTLRARLQDDVQSGRISGATALVMQNGEPVAAVCEGYSDANAKMRLTENAIFQLASMTKPVTALAVLICEDRKLLSISDKVSKYFPQYRNKHVGRRDTRGAIVAGEPVGDVLRISHLLSHSNGIVAGEIGAAQYEAMPLESKKDLRSATDWYAEHLLLDFAPDTKEVYGGRSFDVAVRIVEMVAGMPYPDFVAENICRPLGLADLTYTPTEAQLNRLVKMYGCPQDKAGGAGPNKIPPGGIGYIGGGTGLFGTAADYAVFAEMLLGGGVYNGVRIVREESVQKLKTPCRLWNEKENWGLGVRVIAKDPYLPAGTYGWSGAFGTHFWVDEKNGIAAVYMKNSFDEVRARALTAHHFEEDVYTSFS